MESGELLYDNPRYYELALSFRDIAQEVETFEQCMRLHSRIEVKRLLELACGPSPHLEEIARRGYKYVGVDVNENMLAYARRKAGRIGASAEFVKGDMLNFELNEPADFVFTALGLLHARRPEEVVWHLDIVAKALKPGGLYLMDWCINFQWEDIPTREQQWSVEKEGVKIKARFRTESDLTREDSQLCKRRIIVDVDDHGERVRLEAVDSLRVTVPEEFLALLDRCGKFEFVGWWSEWNIPQAAGAARINRPVSLLRRIKPLRD